GEPTAEGKLRLVEAMLTRRGFNLAEAVPLFARLLSLPLPARYPAPDLSPQRLKQNTQELLIELLRCMERERPLLLLVEDLHWTDHSTLELLGLALERIPDGRTFLLLTCRPEFRSPSADCPHLTPVSLYRL